MTMQAIVQHGYGGPQVLRLETVPRPVPLAGEMLIRVEALTVSFAETAMRKADPFIVRFFTGFFTPKHPVPGDTLAGEVVAVGAGVSRFTVGDRVFGFIGERLGTAAEFAIADAGSSIVALPPDVPSETAVAACDGYLTALPFLRDEAGLKAGDRIAIVGAGGAVGSIAVQLAKLMGAEVTAICSAAKAEQVRLLGADRVIDYAREDFSEARNAYEVIFDAAGKSSFSRCRDALTERGVYLTTVPDPAAMIGSLLMRNSTGRRVKFAATGLRSAEAKLAYLELLVPMLQSGQIRPLIGQRFRLAQMADAHAYAEAGHKTGSAVIRVGN